MTPPPPPIWIVDTECYPNYWLCMFRHATTGELRWWEADGDMFDLRVMFERHCTIGFNSKHYDMPMIAAALAGATCAQLKDVNDAIILRGMKPWDIEREYGYTVPQGWDHVDLFDVAPGVATSLKMYGGRMHSKRLRDLPFDPNVPLTPAQIVELREYCGNDLITTVDMYNKLQPQLELRAVMGTEYGLDLRSKSDAQIAEAVIRQEVQNKLGYRIYRPELDQNYSFHYKVPSFVQFEAPGLQHMLSIMRSALFTLDSKGAVEMPTSLDSMRIRIGRGVYRMGLGGLHSTEANISERVTQGWRIVDRDVTSYYPTIILTQELFPAHMGRAFLEVYRKLVDDRIEAKRAGQKVKADALKICVNGSFGKLGSPWSVLYSPDLLIAVTLTGQLALLMLIEMIDGLDIDVVSANTDGVVSMVSYDRRAEFEAVIAWWECITGFVTEETEYVALYSKDVNNYIAIKPDGTTKLKGSYATAGMQKNPANEVCVDAVIAYLTTGKPIADTLRECTDVRKFLTIRNVKGGGMYDGQYLGRAVRWYYAVGETRHIAYATNGKKVARSEGCRPLMELPDAVPADVNLRWYWDEAMSILGDIGL